MVRVCSVHGQMLQNEPEPCSSCASQAGHAHSKQAHLLQKPRISSARYWLAMMRSTPCSVDLQSAASNKLIGLRIEYAVFCTPVEGETS
jgi:hypothetical protein